MPTRGRTIAWCCAALVLLRVVIVGVALDQQATAGHHTVLPGDVRRFHQIARRRGTPYADFTVEYPPLTLAAIDALDGRTVRQATVHLMWSQVALDALIALLLAWGWGRRAALLYLLLGLAFAWYPFLYLRLDLLSVALAVGGLALLRRRSAATGGALVAVACFAKLWPLVLAPGFAARRSWRALAAFLAVGVTGAAAWVGWAGIDGPVQVLTFRGAKGWQIESTIGAVLHVFAGADAHIERGAARLGVVPDWARLGLPALALLGVGAVWWLLHRRPHAPVHVVDGVAPVAAVAMLLVGATLLSPQYVSWLLPVRRHRGGRRGVGHRLAHGARRRVEHARPQPREGGEPRARAPDGRGAPPQRRLDRPPRGRGRADPPGAPAPHARVPGHAPDHRDGDGRRRRSGAGPDLLGSPLMGAATTDEWATAPAADPAPDVHPRRRELVLRALPVAFLVVLGWSHRWVEEDAFLNFRIVDQIRAGHGPVFNIGQRVEVATSPLWLAMLTVARSVVPFVRIEYLSIVGGLVLTGLGLWWVQAGAARLWRLEGAGAIVPFGRGRGGGAPRELGVGDLRARERIEPGVDRRAHARARDGGTARPAATLAGEDRRVGVLLGLGPLVRPDLTIMSAAAIVAVLVVRRPRGAQLAWFLAGCLTLPVLSELFRMGYYGILVPNTALAKDAGGTYWSQGWNYLVDLVAPYWLWVPVARGRRGRGGRVGR